VTSLLGWLQGTIERTYSLPRNLVNAGHFVMGDAGLRRLQARGDRTLRVVGQGGGAGPGACLFLRPAADGRPWRASIYYPDAMIERLEARPPTRGLDEKNFDDFAALVEELDHLLCVVSRLASGRPFSLLELELQANITKYLAAMRLAAGGPAGTAPAEDARAWVRWQLFEKGEFTDEDPQVRARYENARRLAARFLDRIETSEPRARLERLRAFHRGTHHEKLAMLS
jgi:hypothetical protein